MSHPSRVTTSVRPAALVAVLLTVLAGLFVPVGAPAHAADNGAWSVTPTPPKKGANTPRNYFILEGVPGARIKDKVRIQNWTDRPITLNLYAADAYNTATDGFFALRDLGDEMTDVGRWVKPLVAQVTVDGRTQTDVPVTVRIPRNASPGDHAGGIVALNTAVERQPGDRAGMDIGIQRAVAARVYVRVSGTTRPGLEVDDVTFTHDRGAWPWSGKGTGTVSWTVTNTGNVRLAPDAEVSVRGLLGKDVRLQREELLDLLPGQSTRMTQEVTGVGWIGRAVAEVELDAGQGLASSGTASAWLVPWPAFVLLLALLAAAAAGWHRRATRVRRRMQAAEEAPRITVAAGA